MFGPCTEETLRGLGWTDYVTDRECLESWEIRKESATHRCRIICAALVLIQIIGRLRPIHVKAVLEGRGYGRLCVRGTIRDGQEPKTKGMILWADSKWSLEKLRLELQVVKGVSGSADRRTDTVACSCVARPIERVRARILPNDVRHTNENRQTQELHQWRLGSLLYTTPDASGVDPESEFHGQWFRKRQAQDKGANGDTLGLLLQRDLPL